MAERRMFTKKVTDDDHFVTLSSSAQALYLHLMMSADDDGFCNQVNASMFKAHASVDDLKSLLEKRYLLEFENGVMVIKHWRMANALRSDRYKPTAYQEEISKLELKDNGSYTFKEDWLPDGCQVVATEENRIGKKRIEYKKHKYGEFNHVLLTDEEVKKLHEAYGEELTNKYIKLLDEGIELKGYKYKSHYLAIKKWIGKDKPKEEEIPSYDSSSNPEIDKERLKELMERRKS